MMSSAARRSVQPVVMLANNLFCFRAFGRASARAFVHARLVFRAWEYFISIQGFAAKFYFACHFICQLDLHNRRGAKVVLSKNDQSWRSVCSRLDVGDKSVADHCCFYCQKKTYQCFVWAIVSFLPFAFCSSNFIWLLMYSCITLLFQRCICSLSYFFCRAAAGFCQLS